MVSQEIGNYMVDAVVVSTLVHVIYWDYWMDIIIIWKEQTVAFSLGGFKLRAAQVLKCSWRGGTIWKNGIFFAYTTTKFGNHKLWRKGKLLVEIVIIIINIINFPNLCSLFRYKVADEMFFDKNTNRRNPLLNAKEMSFRCDRIIVTGC